MLHIELRVLFGRRERLLRLGEESGEWSAGLLVPGKTDMFGQCPEPSPPGSKLPKAEIKDRVLKIEAPVDHVVDMPRAALMASPHVSVQNGWLVVPLGGVACDYGDPVVDKWSTIAQPQAEILPFPGSGRSRE